MRIGNVRGPRTCPDDHCTGRSGDSASSKSGMRFIHSSIATDISRRARFDPMHRWMPSPNATWRLRSRSITNSSARSNTSGSRLADGNGSSTQSRLPSVWPPISTSSATMRAMVTGA